MRAWQAVGIDTSIRAASGAELERVTSKNSHDIVLFGGEGGKDVLSIPTYYFPSGPESRYAVAWARWYNNPNADLAESPPQAVQRQMRLYEELKSTSDRDVQTKLMMQILDIAADQFYVIGIGLQPRGAALIKDGFYNVPDPLYGGWSIASPAYSNPCQYFIESAEDSP